MTTNQSYLTEVRDKIFGGPDRDLFLHVGYFLCWFAHVELNLTFLLARTINHKQLDDFELLVKGMDARVKCERLRKALKGKKQLGPNFSKRLIHFENNLIGLRNKVTHSVVASPLRDGTLHFASLARLPFNVTGQRQIGTPPENMSSLALFERGLWLNFYCDDLNTVLGEKFDRETLEIDHPRSPMQPASR